MSTNIHVNLAISNMLPLQNQNLNSNSNYLTNIPDNSVATTTMVSGKSQIRPSSPRQFFARLYGHLESSNADAGSVNHRRPSSAVAVTADTNLKSPYNTETSAPFASPSANCDLNYQSDGATSTSSPDISISDDRCECV